MSSRAPGTQPEERAACDPGVWHKDGPLAQVRWMAEWADRGRTGDGIGPETAGKIAKNLRAAADALERRESDARCDTAAPSDEAIRVATQAIAGHDIWRAFDADARAVLPWWLAKDAVAAAAPVIRAEERAATLREVEAWMRERAEQQPHDWPWASFADALAAHFNPEAE